MGSLISKAITKPYNEETKALREKIKHLQEELTQAKSKREHEIRAYEQQTSAFKLKESEWNRERKKWKEKVGKLRKKVQDKEGKMQRLEEQTVRTGKGDKDCESQGANFLVEHMREERATREEAVEKWKRLYLAIKTELDDLIRITRQGERLWWGAEDDAIMEGLQTELKAKQETVEALRAKVLAMEKEGATRESEFDILRQSLRIISNTNKAQSAKIRFPSSNFKSATIH